jgi:Arc/MetJ-type ribon-helix-helix transcriptional regulator
VKITLTTDQETFIRQAIKTGRLDRVEDVVTEALLLWEERERQRSEFLLSLDDARDSIARGEGIPITRESMRDLAEDVMRRGRERLDVERQTQARQCINFPDRPATILTGYGNILSEKVAAKQSPTGK